MRLNNPFSAVQPVLLAVSTPKRVCPGGKCSVRFVAYNKQLEEEIPNIFANLNPRSMIQKNLKKTRWAAGTLAKVRFYGDHVTAENPEQQFIWNGAYEIRDFVIEVSFEAPLQTIVGKFDVLVDEIRVGTIRQNLQVSSYATPFDLSQSFVTAAQSAYISYAPEDKRRVLYLVDSMKISSGMDLFVDCLSLCPSEQLKFKLEKEIGKRDLFVIFWSNTTKNSQYVAWEWKTALKTKARDSIILQPLQSLSEVPCEPQFDTLSMTTRTIYDISNCKDPNLQTKYRGQD